jgi:4-carboxymuconolactone decarboxylase
MAKAPPSARRDRIQPVVPALVEYTNSLIYGDVWERPGLSKRDRSLVTLGALIGAYRPEQLNSHIQRALKNGVTKEEISEIITHLAFYAGWPSSMTAAHVLCDVLESEAKS